MLAYYALNYASIFDRGLVVITKIYTQVIITFLLVVMFNYAFSGDIIIIIAAYR